VKAAECILSRVRRQSGAIRIRRVCYGRRGDAEDSITVRTALRAGTPPPGSHHSPTSPNNPWGRLGVGQG